MSVQGAVLSSPMFLPGRLPPGECLPPGGVCLQGWGCLPPGMVMSASRGRMSDNEIDHTPPGMDHSSRGVSDYGTD